MREKFTRADLKSGYVVKLRDGSFRMVIRAGNFTKILVSQTGAWNYLNSGWSDDLKSLAVYPASQYEAGHTWQKADIMEVYGLVSGTQFYGGCLQITPDNRSLLWQRKQPVKMTIEEISQKLGFDVEIVAASYKE